MMIHLDGDTGVGGFRGGVINGSDKRIKNTILDLSKKQSSEFIYSLRAKSYRYNFEKDGFHHGFIAQDVLESVEEGWNICPQIFSNGNGEKYYGLNYTELIADLVATVQLQHEEIKGLFFSFSASKTSKAPLSFAISTEERYAESAKFL